MVLFSFGIVCTPGNQILLDGWILVSLLRKPLQESCCQVLNEEYGFVHTHVSSLLPPNGVQEDPGHLELLLLLPLWSGSFVPQPHSIEDCMDFSTPS